MHKVNITNASYVQGEAVIDSESSLGGGLFALWQREPARWIAEQGWGYYPTLAYLEPKDGWCQGFDAEFRTKEHADVFVERWGHLLHYREPEA